MKKALKTCLWCDTMDPVNALVWLSDFPLHGCNFAIFIFSHIEKYMFKLWIYREVDSDVVEFREYLLNTTYLYIVLHVTKRQR